MRANALLGVAVELTCYPGDPGVPRWECKTMGVELEGLRVVGASKREEKSPGAHHVVCELARGAPDELQETFLQVGHQQPFRGTLLGAER